MSTSTTRVYRDVPRLPATAAFTSDVTSNDTLLPTTSDTVWVESFVAMSPPAVNHFSAERRLFQVVSVSVHEVVT